MPHSHHFHHASHHTRRETFPESEPVLPRHLVPDVEAPTPAIVEASKPILAARSKSTCGPNDDSGTCQKPTGSNTIPIVLAAVIPIAIAIIVLYFLHRRHLKKQKLEEQNDPHKSLDFGLEVQRSGKHADGPEMQITNTEKAIRHGKGLSMDMGGSPYLLPAALHGSRESFHSMSRSMHDTDPYRPVTFMRGDNDSIRSFPRSTRVQDNASVYTGSSGGTDNRPNANLLKNAQRMSTSAPPRADSISPHEKSTPSIQLPDALSIGSGPTTAPQSNAPNGGLAPAPNAADRDSYFDKNASTMRKSNNYLGAFIHSREPSADNSGNPQRAQDQVEEDKEVKAPAAPASPPRPPRFQSMEATVHHTNTKSIVSETSDYGDGFKITPPSPPRETAAVPPRQQSLEVPRPGAPGQPSGLAVQGVDHDQRRLSLVMRPLPIDDPTDNPEQRANRIRSFYKEYFDESRPDPVGQYGDYIEDYGQEYLDGAMFDPDSGQFVVAGAPYAQPVTRRAMTPPPRAPPRHFNRGGNGPRGHISSGSTSRFMPPRGRSAMSGRHPPPGPRKPMPPPTPLQSLPTPHMLKEDSMVFNPIDFAPPTSFRDRQAGRRPDSPLGIARPYSPAVRPHTPLASSFDDLSFMPSPHALRKSGTFTALDFAPPPRFKNADSGSDAASIRSNGSGMSAMQLHSLRAGAYRVSRLPKEVAGTKNDLAEALKPTWDLRGVNPGAVSAGR